MKLRKFSLTSGERGALLAVGGLLGVYFGTSQAHHVRRETQKKGCSSSTSCYLRWR
nr:hypothetical protein [uncultured Campylobacter sp.]